jgi:hypothetical protein
MIRQPQDRLGLHLEGSVVALVAFSGYLLLSFAFDWSLGHSFILLCGTFVPDVGLRQKIPKRVKRLCGVV